MRKIFDVVAGLLCGSLVLGCEDFPSADVHTSARDPEHGERVPAWIWSAPTQEGVGALLCDPWEISCPGGEKCHPKASGGGPVWDSLACVPVSPTPAELGQPCVVQGGGAGDHDDCDAGLLCWVVEPGASTGVCRQQCHGSPEQPVCDDTGDRCVIANDGVLTVCLPNCDPLVQGCAAASEACIADPGDRDRFVCVADASGPGGGWFEPCEHANACDSGLLCADPALAAECDQNMPGCCLGFCDTGDSYCELMGQVCRPWYEEGRSPPGLETVGICVNFGAEGELSAPMGLAAP